MTVNTISKTVFELNGANNEVIGGITYENNGFNEATIRVSDNFILKQVTTGIWATLFADAHSEKLMCTIRVETGGTMSVRKFYKRRKYLFRKSENWKLRFSLLNADNEELLGLIPTVNWQKESHDFVLQVNEELEEAGDAFLVLQALHCAICSLSMMTGGKVPALVSI